MKSKLIIAPVEKLQSKIVNTMKSLSGIGIYVSLNKGRERIKKNIKKNKVDLKNMFFIDCVGSGEERREDIQISPARLDDIDCAINAFMDEIEGKKFLVIDALSVLLIYNNENRVASFMRKVIKHASDRDVEVIAFSPKTKGEELLNKIFSSFDEVRGK